MAGLRVVQLCDVDLATVLFVDAIGLSQSAGQIFWRHDEAKRYCGFLDARLDQGRLSIALLKVNNVFLEAIRDVNLIPLGEGFDRKSLERVHHLNGLASVGAIVSFVSILRRLADLLLIQVLVRRSKQVDILCMEDSNHLLILLHGVVHGLAS